MWAHSVGDLLQQGLSQTATGCSTSFIAVAGQQQGVHHLDDRLSYSRSFTAAVIAKVSVCSVF